MKRKSPIRWGRGRSCGNWVPTPEEALLVGDSEVDMQTARNAGMMAAAVNYGFGVHDRGAYPADIYLDSFDALVPLIESRFVS